MSKNAKMESQRAADLQSLKIKAPPLIPSAAVSFDGGIAAPIARMFPTIAALQQSTSLDNYLERHRAAYKDLEIVNRVSFAKDARLYLTDHGMVGFKGFIHVPGFPVPSMSVIQNTFMHGQLLRRGPKIMHLTNFDLSHLEETTLSIGFADFHQPFPLMLVEIPKDFGSARGIAPDVYPLFVAVFHSTDPACLLVNINMKGGEVITNRLHPFGDTIRTIEESLTSARTEFSEGLSPAELVISRDFTRIAVNALMFLANYPHLSAPSNPDNFANLERKLKVAERKRNKQRASEMKNAIRRHPIVFTIDQSIALKLFARRPETPSEPTGLVGSAKSSHERRGHWRRQAIGKRWTAHRIRWIHNMFINWDCYWGEPGDSKAVYE